MTKINKKSMVLIKKIDEKSTKNQRKINDLKSTITETGMESTITESGMESTITETGTNN